MNKKASHLKRPANPMPGYVREALKERGLFDAYHARPPYQQNDYIGWITRAKREETRLNHLEQMLDELERGDVYMKMAYTPGRKQAPKSKESGPTVDDYLAPLPEEVRDALSRLRKLIMAAAPGAEETMSYRVPTYKYKGPLVGFAAFKDHCSFFAMSPAVMEAYKRELKGYYTSKGTIRFTVDKPLPAALVKKLVRARIKENEAHLKK